MAAKVHSYCTADDLMHELKRAFQSETICLECCDEDEVQKLLQRFLRRVEAGLGEGINAGLTQTKTKSEFKEFMRAFVRSLLKTGRYA